jgi:hypothetical protein
MIYQLFIYIVDDYILEGYGIIGKDLIVTGVLVDLGNFGSWDL